MPRSGGLCPEGGGILTATQSELTIRSYHPSDLDRCRALWVELTERHRQIYGDPGIGGESPGLHFDWHLARVGPERIWVAEQGGEIVGLTGLIVDGREAEVEPAIVAATHRGRGIGRALLDRAVAEARSLGVRYLSVRPVARNVEAISFFHDAGFRVLGHLELFMDLQPQGAGAWKRGPELFGLEFKY